MKRGLIVLVCLVAAGALLWVAYQKGQSKYLYTIQPLDKFVPVPIIYDLATGFASWHDDRQLRCTWNHVSIPPKDQRDTPYFICLGYVDPGPQPYYVLELNGKLFLEKAEHIEPLIHALCALSRGGPPENHPKTVNESIACLPDDVAVLEALVSRFKEVEVHNP